MKNIKTIIYIMSIIGLSFTQNLAVEWRLSPEAGALGVGWDAANIGSWWSSSEGDVSARSCLFDDKFVFNTDGTFQNVLGNETWLEGWQGVSGEGCGTPIAPHDGSNPATWTIDEVAGTITLNGLGAYLGLAKVTNQNENGVADDNTIVYNYTLSDDGSSMDITIDYPNGVWGFKMRTSDSIDSDPCADVTCGDWEECVEGSCVEISNIDITFNLDFSSSGLDNLPEVAYTGGGDFGGPDAVVLTDPDGDGIYTGVQTVATNSSSFHTYLTCPDWGCKENISGQNCADPNNYNDRFLSWGEQDLTVNACFGLCGDGLCGDLEAPAEVNVTFSVDMSAEETHPEGVFIAGGGFGQEGHLMDDSDGDDVWTVTLPLISNSTHYYKFRNQPSFGTWDGFEPDTDLISGGCSAGQYNDRFVETSDSDIVLPTVSYGSCVLDTPVDPCADVTCDDGQYCENGVCLEECLTSGVAFDGTFGGSVYDCQTYTNPTGSEPWAGFANQDESLYPFSFTNGGTVTFTGSTSNGESADIYFRFEYQPFPDTEPSYNTESITVSGESASYSLSVPSQGDNTFSSFLLYVTTPDVAVTVTDVSVDSGPVNTNPSVTLNVNMNCFDDVDFTTVYVNGPFTNWCGDCTPMSDENGDGVWSITIDDQPAGELEYKYTLDGWLYQEDLLGQENNSCVGVTDGVSYANRIVTLLDGESVETNDSFGSCDECDIVPSTSPTVTFQVDMRFANSQETFAARLAGGNIPYPDGVEGFQGLEMTDADGDNIYEVSVELEPNTYYNYKFTNGLNDGWGGPYWENISGDCGDPANYNDRFFTTGDSDMTLPVVCFSSCDACAEEQLTSNLTFKVNMAGTEVSTDGVFLHGNWFGWGEIEMTDEDGDCIYETTVEVVSGQVGEYLFKNGGANEQVPVDCENINNWGGGVNRLVTMPDEDTVLDPICYSQCEGAECSGDCGEVTITASMVTFQVDMSENPGITDVALQGDFAGWYPGIPMSDDDGDGVYTVTVELFPGTYEYKFAGYEWSTTEFADFGFPVSADAPSCLVLNDCDENGENCQYFNRTVDVIGSDMTLPEVCWASCFDCGDVGPGPESPLAAPNWRLAPEAGALHVGPGGGETWWSNSVADVTERACLFDDEYVFNSDGSFQNILGDATWIEDWQNGGAGEGCGTPVAPHDGTNPATWSLDEANGTLTVSGLGSFVGLAKAHNTGEDGSPVDNTTTYNYSLSDDGHSMTVSVYFGWGEWTYQLKTVESLDSSPCADVTCGDWEECVEGECVEIPNVEVTFNVDMSGVETSLDGAFIAGGGTFGNPGDNPMTDMDGDDVWTFTTRLHANSGTDYTFLNGNCGDWSCKENLTGQSCGVPPYNDRHLDVGTEDVVVNACFAVCGDGTCNDLEPPATINVTFQVDMNGYTWDGNGLHVTGNFEGWSGTGPLMSDPDGDGVYSADVEIVQNTVVEYKYVIGGWGGIESGAELGSECDFIPDDGYNNYGFTAGTEDMVLPVYIFGGGCAVSGGTVLCGTGDVTNDGSVNVSDIVYMVANVLGNNTFNESEDCAGDMNDDGLVNVVDIVQVVQLILGTLVIEASSVDIIKTPTGVNYLANGNVGGFQITLTHNDNFYLELTEDAMVADYVQHENKTTVVVIMPETDELFTSYGDYEISEVLAASSEGAIGSNVITIDKFNLSKAYPNPFNPTTEFNIQLPADGMLKLNIYDVSGKKVDVIYEGFKNMGSFNFSWNASNYSSGVYFIEAVFDNSSRINKVLLTK